MSSNQKKRKKRKPQPRRPPATKTTTVNNSELLLTEGLIRHKMRSMDWYLADYFIQVAVGQPMGSREQLKSYIQKYGCHISEKATYLENIMDLMVQAKEEAAAAAKAANEAALKESIPKGVVAPMSGAAIPQPLPASPSAEQTQPARPAIGAKPMRIRAHADYGFTPNESPSEPEPQPEPQQESQPEPEPEKAPAKTSTGGIPGL